jgi:hypothetical protein
LPNPVSQPLLEAVDRYTTAKLGDGYFLTAIDGFTIPA